MRRKLPDEWKVKPLKKVAEIQTGIAKGKTNIKDPVQLPYLRVANVQDGYLDLSNIKKIPLSIQDIERYSLKMNDVLLTEGGDFDKLGRGCVWNDSIKPCLHQNHIFVVRTNDKILLPHFFSAQTGSRYGKLYFLSCSKQTTNLASINSTQLKNFPVIIPPLSEQLSIMSVISLWSRVLEKTSKLIETKLRLKQALMQKLFSGKKRFKEFKEQDWRIVSLGNIFKERRETNNTGLPLLSITADRGVICREELNKKDTSNTDKSKYKRIAPGDIGYNTMRMWQGNSGVSELEGIVSPAYTICIPTKEIDPKFAGYLFKYPPIIHLFYRYSQGLVRDTLNLKFNNFAQIKVKIPGIQEQRKIANIFSTCDKEVDLLCRIQDHLLSQKRSLMQKLLTGNIRVPVDS